MESVSGSHKYLDGTTKGEELTHPTRNCQQKECVELLIKAGGDVNAQTDSGISALMKASENGYDGCIKLLLKAGADVNAQTDSGISALMKASENGYDESAKLLLEAGADVNATCNDGYTSLIHSVMYGHETCVKDLNAAGGDVNALVRGAEMGNIPVIKRLLKANCGINMDVGPRRHTALSSRRFCSCPKNRNISMLLLAAGETAYYGFIERAQNILKLEDSGIQLSHICRKAIRKHLLDLDPHQHLFGRISLLGLPKFMNKFLLYGESLDDDNDD